MTKLELTNRYGTFTIDRPDQEDLPIAVLVDDIVCPLLMATGYCEALVRETLGMDPMEGE